MKNLLHLTIAIVIISMASCTKEQPATALFNGDDLSNWDKYIGSPLAGFDSLAKAATPLPDTGSPESRIYSTATSKDVPAARYLSLA